MRSRGTQSIHRVNCDVWSVPDRHPTPGSDVAADATVAYLAAVAPAYNTLLHVTGQLGAHLLLSVHPSSSATQLEDGLCERARDLLAESAEQLSTARVPGAASRYNWAIHRAAAALQQAVSCMERLSFSRDAHRLRLVSDSIRLLNTAHRLLQWTAQPDAGLSPIDLEQACCSCATVDHNTVSPARQGTRYG